MKVKVADMTVESPHWYEYLVSGFNSVTVTWWMNLTSTAYGHGARAEHEHTRRQAGYTRQQGKV